MFLYYISFNTSRILLLPDYEYFFKYVSVEHTGRIIRRAKWLRDPFVPGSLPLYLSRLSLPPFHIYIYNIYVCIRPCGRYPIPINFNDERGQFNTSWTHCSKLVGNKSYALVTEKCMTQISAGVICYTPAAYPVASLLCVALHPWSRIHVHVMHCC